MQVVLVPSGEPAVLPWMAQGVSTPQTMAGGWGCWRQSCLQALLAVPVEILHDHLFRDTCLSRNVPPDYRQAGLFGDSYQSQQCRSESSAGGPRKMLASSSRQAALLILALAWLPEQILGNLK